MPQQNYPVPQEPARRFSVVKHCYSLDDKEQHRVAKALRQGFGNTAVVTLPPTLRRSELKVWKHDVVQV